MECVITQVNHITVSVSGLIHASYPHELFSESPHELLASLLSRIGHDPKNPSVGARLPKEAHRTNIDITWCLVHRELTWTFLQVLVRLSKDLDKTQ